MLEFIEYRQIGMNHNLNNLSPRSMIQRVTSDWNSNIWSKNLIRCVETQRLIVRLCPPLLSTAHLAFSSPLGNPISQNTCIDSGTSADAVLSKLAA